MRKSLIAFGTVTGTAAVIAVAPYFLDWNWFKPQLVSAVEAATGYDVEVAGDIGFSLLPTPRLSAERLTVRGFGTARQPLVTADKLSAAVAFLPLLSGRAEVKYIALVAPTIRLVSYADGTSNWKDAGAKAESGDGELSIDDFRVENGTFISAAADGEMTRVDDIDLAITVGGADGPYDAKGSLLYGELPVRITANMKSGGGVKVEADLADAGHVDFAGQVGTASGDGGTPVSGRVAVRGERLGALLAAFGGQEESKAAAYAQPFRVAAKVHGTTKRLRVAAIDGNVAGSDLGGDLDVVRGERTRVDGRLALARLDIADWQSDEPDDDEPFELPEAIDADLLLRVVELRYGDMRFGAANAPVRLQNRVVTIGKTALSLAGGGSVGVWGTLDAERGEPRFRGRFTADMPKPARTLAALGNDSYVSMPPLTLAGGIGYAKDVVALAVQGRFDGKPLSADVRYPVDETAPMTVALAAQSINLDRLVSKPPRASDEKSRPFVFNVRLGELVSNGKRFGGVSASGRYAGNSVTLAKAVVSDAFGFGVSAKGRVDDVSGDKRTDLAVGLAGEGVSGAITVKGPVANMDVGGAVTYAGAKIALDGWVKTKPATAYELTATAAAPEAGVVLARLQDEPRAAKLGPLDLAMKIVGAGDAVRISGISGKVGSMTLGGDAAINTSGAVPLVNATLRAGVVPVLALLGDDGTGAAEAVKGGARWSSEALSFDWIRRFDGRISLSADRAVYDTYVLDKPSMVLANRGDTLAIESMKGGMYGGALAVSGSLRAGAPQSLALKFALNNVPVEPLLKASMASAPATGTLDMTGNVTSSGGSQKALMANLAGPVRIAATNGIIRKVDLKKLDEQLGDLRTVNSLAAFAGSALRGGETPYRTLAVDATGRGGRFTIEKMTSDMDGGSMTAKGYVDIGQWYADTQATFRLGSHDDAPAIPATVKGPLPTPTVSYNLSPLTAWFAKRVALVGLKAAAGEDKLDIGGLLGVKKPDASKPAVADGEAAPQPPAATKPKTVEEELGGALVKGLGSLLGKKKTAPAPQPPAPSQPAEETPLEPADLGDPN